MNKPNHQLLLETGESSEIELSLDNQSREQVKAISQFELIKLEKVARDVSLFMTQVCASSDRIFNHAHDPSTFLNYREDLINMTRISAKIDTFLRSSFSVVSSSEHRDLTKLLQHITLQSMDTLNRVTRLQQYVDRAADLIEVRDMILEALVKEIEECTSFLTSLNLTPSPFDSNATISVDSLAQLLSSVTSVGDENLFASTSPLCAMTSTEVSFCREIELLERRLTPMQVSIDLLTQRVADLNCSRGCFAAECEQTQEKASDLVKRWSKILAGFALLKSETIGTRLVSVFRYLNTQAFEIINQLTEELDTFDPNSKEVGVQYKSCSAAITLIRKLSKSGMPGLQGSIHRFNLEILPQWNNLNEVLTKKQLVLPLESVSFTKKASHDDLKLLRCPKTNATFTPLAELIHKRASVTYNRATQHSMGLGINLHLGVQPSPSVPYSICKSNRITDLDLDYNCLPQSSFQVALLQSSSSALGEPKTGLYNKSGRSGEGLSPPSTPAMFSLQSPVQMDEVATTETTPFYKDTTDDLTLDSIHKTNDRTIERKKSKTSLTTSNSDTMKSRIPRMVFDYPSLRLPVLPKKCRPEYGVSRIPTISPDNEVFCSPERRSSARQPSTLNPGVEVQDTSSRLVAKLANCEGLRSPPAFLIAHETISKQPHNSVKHTRYGALSDVTNKQVRGSSAKAPARKVSLQGVATPNLTFFRDASIDSISPVSWRSTSPERPGSSMGSRFDEKHLTQPLKHQKKRWT